MIISTITYFAYHTLNRIDLDYHLNHNSLFSLKDSFEEPLTTTKLAPSINHIAIELNTALPVLIVPADSNLIFSIIVIVSFITISVSLLFIYLLHLAEKSLYKNNNIKDFQKSQKNLVDTNSEWVDLWLEASIKSDNDIKK